MMLRNVSIWRKGLIVVSAPFALTAVLLFTLYRQGEAIEEAESWSRHSLQILNTIEEIEFGLVDIHGEALQLAIVGSSDRTLELSVRNMEVSQALAKLGDLTQEDPDQSLRIASLRPVAEHLLSDMDTTLRGLRLQSNASFQRQVAANDRKLEEVLRLARELKRTERTLANERLRRTADLVERRRLTLIAGGVATLLFTCLAGLFLTRSMLWRLRVVQENVTRLADERELLPAVVGEDEIGQIDRAFHDMVRNLRAQQSDNDMFVYSVSHDLRSPLVNLQGFGKELRRTAAELREMLADPGVPAPLRERARRLLEHDVGEALDFIDQAVQRQAGIIDSLLRLSRAGRVDYRWQMVDVAKLVRGIVEGMRHRGDLEQVEFVVGDLPPVQGDANAIERVFDNVIGNAVKYLSPDRPGRIEVGANTDGTDLVTYFVRDNGIGIAADQLERVFLPFTRLGSGNGEGIGLSLVRRAVGRHHGQVWIESEPGRGSTVYLTLRAPVAA